MSSPRRRASLVGILLAALLVGASGIFSSPLQADEAAGDADAAPTDIIKSGGADVGDADVEIVQEVEQAAVEPTYGQPIATRMRVGARVEAKGGDVRNIFIMVAVPLDCPEQEVHVVEEDISPNVDSVEFRTLPEIKLAEPGAKQMLISIANLPPRQVASAIVTYEIVTKHVYAPEESSTLKIPAKPPKQLKTYLSGSPYINVGDRKIKEAIDDALAMRAKKDLAEPASASTEAADAASPGDTVEEIDDDPYETVDADRSTEPAKAGNDRVAGRAASKTEEKEKPPTKEEAKAIAAAIEKLSDWEQVEALYDYAREKVKYLDGAEDMSSVQALKAEQADCHGLSALFVAMCRTMKVPARMVWVDGHQYAEFYLEDEAGKGYWYPAQLAGTRAFGEMPTPMVIFQKGDNFRVPERRRERLRYATDHTTLLSSAKHKPRVVYVREPL